MSGEVWTLIGVAITAIVGGSGIAGVLVAAVELSQRNRLQRRSEKALALAQLLPKKSVERRALEYAAALDATRLAALSVVGLPVLVRPVFFTTLAAAGLYLVAGAVMALANSYGIARRYVPLGTFGNLSLVQALILWACFLVVLAGVMSWAIFNGIRDRRERYVREVLNGADPRGSVSPRQPERENRRRSV